MASECGMSYNVAVDEHSNPYSLGIVLFELATGVLPSVANRKREDEIGRAHV